MDNNRNLILAVVLSAVLLFGWDFAVRTFYPDATSPTEVASREDSPMERVEGGEVAPDIEADDAPVYVATALASADRIVIDAPKIHGSINPIGAQVDDIDLKTHRETVDEDSDNIRMFTPAGTRGQHYARFRWDAEGLAVPGSDTVWQVIEGERLTQQSPVTLGWDNGEGLEFTLRFAIDEHYMLTATQGVRNTGENTVALRPFSTVTRTSETASDSFWNVHSGPIAANAEGVNFDWDYEDVLEEGPVSFGQGLDWIGFTDVYWMSSLVADDGATATGNFRSLGDSIYRAELVYDPVNVAAGETATRTTRLFAGAKESAVLSEYEDEAGVERFGLAIDWGWFRWIAWPMWQVLIFLFGLVGNFGVAIICLTIIIRLLMFPIAQKQFASMAQLRAVQPKMKALQERYKDDKQQLQQEMAKLYKEEKVNPLAGCLPIFLQIPIFFALYKVLLLAIEMRHEPFFGWLKDLSAPDPATILNLFGLLPFDPPGFLAIGVLAVLLGFTMWLQFKLNPAAMDPMQQQIFMIMPWVLMFVMAPFAAGLLLYWITSNILTLAQQTYLYSRHPQLKVQMLKDKEEKARAAEREKAKG